MRRHISSVIILSIFASVLLGCSHNPDDDLPDYHTLMGKANEKAYWHAKNRCEALRKNPFDNPNLCKIVKFANDCMIFGGGSCLTDEEVKMRLSP